jgi:hypothetical protein
MIWIFGDSFSCEFQKHIDNKNQWAIDYCEYKGKIPKSFGELLGGFLNDDISILAKPGIDNYKIFHSYISVVDKIKEDDILIFGWSNVLRYRLANQNDEFITILPTSQNVPHLFELFNNELSKNTIEEILLTRGSKLYYDELLDFIKIIKFSSKSDKIYNWSPFPDNRINVRDLHKISPSGINVETNEKINDEHYGEIGHLSLAHYFMKYIRNKHDRLL